MDLSFKNDQGCNGKTGYSYSRKEAKQLFRKSTHAKKHMEFRQKWENDLEEEED